MRCLVIRLSAAMQSWGTQSRFTERDTGLEPSRSGVVGLLCAAMGIDREDDEALVPLARLGMGVRVDHPGVVCTDFHTAGGGALNRKPYGVAKASGSKGGTVVSRRHFLSDAEFYVALSGDKKTLESVDRALHNPAWPLYLGRKSFPPEWPLNLGIHDGEAEQVLTTLPWRKRRPWDDVPSQLRLVLECGPEEGAVRQDVPLSLANDRRSFAVRYVKNEYCAGFPVVESLEELVQCTSHA